ncbi:MAG: hypothetical protein WBL31_16340 [Ilumatobacteraceae bacterium]
MTAIAQRRTRRTIAALTGAIGLVIVAAVLFTVGVVTLSNSQEGEAVGVDDRPRVALPSTPNALLAVTDDAGQLASVVVMTLLPEGQGGSIVTVPVNADATAGFGLQRRPLNEVFDPDAPDELVVAVEEMLSIGIDLSAVVDPAGLEAILEQFESVQVVLPDAVVDSDAIEGTSATSVVPDNSLPDDSVPDDTVLDVPEGSVPDGSEPGGGGSSNDPAVDEAVGVDGIVFTAGPQILGPAELVGVLTAIDESVPAYEQHALDVEVWSAIADLAPLQIPPEPVTTDGEGRPVPPSSVEELASLLFAGEVGVRDLAATPASAGTNPTDADVVVLERSDVMLVFAQISPSLVSTPNTGLKMRIESQFDEGQLATTDGLIESNSDLARELIGRLLFLQANVVSVDTTASGAPDLTIVEVADPRLLEESIRASEILFGPSEVRLATTVLEGVDIVVTLGTPYLEREVDNNDGAAGLVPDDTAPASTVDADG